MSETPTRTQRVYDPQTNTIKEFQVRPFKPPKAEWPPKDAKLVKADGEPPSAKQTTAKQTTPKTSSKDKPGIDERN